MEIDFEKINAETVKSIKLFEPTGLGNPAPTFVSRKVEVVNARTVGRDSKHLKLVLKQHEQVFDSIYFGGGEKYPKLTQGMLLDIVFQVEENAWNGNRNIQLKIKDIR